MLQNFKLNDSEIRRGVKSYYNSLEEEAFFDGAQFALSELKAKWELKRKAEREMLSCGDMKPAWRLFQRWYKDQREEGRKDIPYLCLAVSAWQREEGIAPEVRVAMEAAIDTARQAMADHCGQDRSAFLSTFPLLYPDKFGLIAGPDAPPELANRDWGVMIRDKFVQDRCEGIPANQVMDFGFSKPKEGGQDAKAD
jgi:hypothetical protein